jgi:hypothetical protein
MLAFPPTELLARGVWLAIVPLMNRRTKTLLIALAALAGVWLVAWAGYAVAQHRKITAEKVKALLAQTDLNRVTTLDRPKVLAELARQLNALSFEERRDARLSGEWDRIFATMSEEERRAFVEATMPTGVKKMISHFEQLPEATRKKTVDDAFKRLREAERTTGGEPAGGAPSRERVPLSEETRQRMVTVGLDTFFKESSSRTQAEVMPLLEEMQRSMQRGRVLR